MNLPTLHIPSFLHKRNPHPWLKPVLSILAIIFMLWLILTICLHFLFSPLPPLQKNWKELAGFPLPQNYLLLFQNSAELRPTGGFLTAFGNLTLTFGLPTTLEIKDSYSIPNPQDPIQAPEAIHKLFSPDPKYSGWTFRDANFSPDFPTSVSDIFKFLQLAGKETDFDGVFAIDLHILEELLEITGPIKINNLTFDKDSLFEYLQFSTKNFDKHNWSEFGTRKNILKTLGTSILKELAFSPTKWDDVISLISQNFDEKHLLAWFSDSDLQAQFQSQNWTGQLIPDSTVLDLAIIESNLGGRKSDRYLRRDIENIITLDDQNHLQGNLRIRLRHLGANAYYTNQFRGDLRIFLPAGATLTSFSGAFPEAPTQTADLGHTVFSHPIFIDAGRSAIFVYEYSLPDSLLQSDTLNLKLWKQPGTDQDFYRTIIRAPQGSRLKSTQGDSKENLIIWETFLDTDKTAQVKISPDTRPPLVVEQKFINQSLGEIFIEFDEELKPDAATQISNFHIWDKNETHPEITDQVQITSANYKDRGITLTISGVTSQPLERFGLTIKSGIFDLSGNALHSGSTSMTIVQRLD